VAADAWGDSFTEQPEPDYGNGGFIVQREEFIRQGPVVSTHLAYITTPDGEEIDREITRHPGAVAVVPIHDGHIIFVKQYRAPINRLMFEIPAGRRDVNGEPPTIAARRELVEEIGYDAGSVELLGCFLNSGGFCDERTYVYLGTDLTPADRMFDGAEEAHMDIVRVPLDQIPTLVSDGSIEDAKTLLGLQWMLLRQAS